MKALFIAGREPAYVRNAVILKCLAKLGTEVVDCSDSSATYPARFLKTMLKFLVRRGEGFDCIFVGFLGQPLVPLVRKFTDKPVIFDAFLSTYDTMCFDRRRFRADSLPGRLFYHLDRLACRMADRVILDTRAHIDYFTGTFGLPREKFHRVLVGADESLFYPRETARRDGRFRVFYCSSYLSLHGTEWIVRAAALLREHDDVEFVVVGRGKEREKVLELARTLALDTIRFVGWLPYERLPLEIAEADICLGGHFSDIEKAGRVIAGKTFQFIAMKKPVILGDGPGNRELFTDRSNCLLVRMADAESLARAILELKDDPLLRERIAELGYRTFLESGSTDAVASQLQGAICPTGPARGRQLHH